jgi:hypothetical protein
MQLENLPSELTMATANLLDLADLKNLRLVNTICANTAWMSSTAISVF